MWLIYACHLSFLLAVCQVILAWTELLQEPRTKREQESRAQVIAQLEAVSESMELDVLLARACYYDLYQQPQLAMECLNQAVALQAGFTPALVEKARLLMSIGDWDLANEVVTRVLSMEPDNLEALRLMALYTVTREANAKAAYNRYVVAGGGTQRLVGPVCATCSLLEARTWQRGLLVSASCSGLWCLVLLPVWCAVGRRLRQLQQALESQEGRNAELHYETAKLFARLVGRQHRDALRLTANMVERAGKLNPDDAAYATELAHERLMLGDSVGAMECFRVASRLNPASTEALHGMVRCQIADGQLEDAEQQMEFLTVISESTGPPSPQALFLQALLAWRKAHDAAAQTSLLDRALDTHNEAYKDASRAGSGALYRRFIALDPDFLLEVAGELLHHGSLIVRTAGPGSPPVDKSVLVPVNRGLRVLERLASQVPGLLIAQVRPADWLADRQAYKQQACLLVAGDSWHLATTAALPIP